MRMEDVLDELERRIRKLEAEIELAEQRLLLMDKVGASTKYTIWERRTEGMDVYMLFFLFFILATLLIFAWIKKRFSFLPISLTPYMIVALVLLLFPVSYFMLRSRKKSYESPIHYLESRENAARFILTSFYNPLREALKNGDGGKIRSLAEMLLHDENLANSLDLLREGDAKLMSYALYLYIYKNPGLIGEMSSTAEKMINKPLKKLLLETIEELERGVSES